MKMKDVFDLPVDVTLKLTGEKSNHKTPDVMLITGHYVLNGYECEMVEDAINNHDNLTEENAAKDARIAELEEALSRGVELLELPDEDYDLSHCKEVDSFRELLAKGGE